MLTALAYGRDPFTGQPIPHDALLNHVEVARALFFALSALDAGPPRQPDWDALRESLDVEVERCWLDYCRFVDSTPVAVGDLAALTGEAERLGLAGDDAGTRDWRSIGHRIIDDRPPEVREESRRLISLLLNDNPRDYVAWTIEGTPGYYTIAFGTIWSGMPDDPEPWCDLDSLPIYAIHPEKLFCRDVPFSAIVPPEDDSQTGSGCPFCGEDHGLEDSAGSQDRRRAPRNRTHAFLASQGQATLILLDGLFLAQELKRLRRGEAAFAAGASAQQPPNAAPSRLDAGALVQALETHAHVGASDRFLFFYPEDRTPVLEGAIPACMTILTCSDLIWSAIEEAVGSHGDIHRFVLVADDLAYSGLAEEISERGDALCLIKRRDQGPQQVSHMPADLPYQYVDHVLAEAMGLPPDAR